MPKRAAFEREGGDRARRFFRSAVSRLVCAVTLCAAAAASRAAAPEAPTFNPRTGLYELPLRALVAAHERRDRAELGRIASRLGPWRLAEALAGSDHAAARAALEALVEIPEAPVFVADLGALILREGREGKSALALRAAEILGRLLGAPRALAEWEVPPDVAASGCAALAQIAGTAAAGDEMRLGALEALGEGSPTCGGRPELQALLADRSPVMRRATLLVLPVTPNRADKTARAQPSARGATPESLLADTTPKVARAAAVAPCRRAERGGARFAVPPPLRASLLADDAAPEDVVDVLPCLQPAGDNEDRRVLETLARRRPSAAAERAREILGSASATKPQPATPSSQQVTK